MALTPIFLLLLLPFPTLPCVLKSHLHFLPTPASCPDVSTTHTTQIQGSESWSYFSSICKTLLILLDHHPSWPSLVQHFFLQDASLFSGLLPILP